MSLFSGTGFAPWVSPPGFAWQPPRIGAQLWPPQPAKSRPRVARRRGRHFVASRYHAGRAQKAYLRLVTDVMAGWRELATGLVMPRVAPFVRQDGVFDLFSELKRRLFDDFDPEAAAFDLSDIADQVDEHQGQQLRDAIDASSKAAQIMGIDPASLSAGSTAQLAAFVQENVARIRGLADTFAQRVQDEVTEAFSEGIRSEDLADRLEDAFGFTSDRAELIATDQVQKLNGQLNGARQQDLGIEQYVWRTMGDNRVRDEHDERDGQVFSWGDAPEDGHPGDPVRCRCYADPVLPGQEIDG